MTVMGLLAVGPDELIAANAIYSTVARVFKLCRKKFETGGSVNQEWFVPRYGTFEVSPLSDPRFVI